MADSSPTRGLDKRAIEAKQRGYSSGFERLVLNPKKGKRRIPSQSLPISNLEG
jgi:hypothetical protein